MCPRIRGDPQPNTTSGQVLGILKPVNRQRSQRRRISLSRQRLITCNHQLNMVSASSETGLLYGYIVNTLGHE